MDTSCKYFHRGESGLKLLPLLPMAKLNQGMDIKPVYQCQLYQDMTKCCTFSIVAFCIRQLQTKKYTFNIAI